MIFYDVHTHRNDKEENVTSIISNSYFEDDKLYSIGLHPWNINLDYAEKLSHIETLANKPNIIAIGEIGLDKVCKTDFELQKAVFIEQLSIAEKYSKPIIIHCVRAFEEVLFLTKNIGVPLIMHGFNKSLELANRLTANGYYLSFGKSLFDNNSKSVEALADMSTAKIFLETDESDFNIRDIYKRAAEIKGIVTEVLAGHIEFNFKKAFKING